LAGMMTVFGSIGAALLSAQGLLATMFRITMIGLVVRLVLLAALIPAWGVLGAAIAVSVATTTEYVLYTVSIMRRFAVGPAALLLVVWRAAFATGAMALGLYLAGFGWHAYEAAQGPAAVVLLCGCGAGAAIYAASLGALWLVAGRPAGPEVDLASLIGGLIGPRLVAFRRKFS
jgi:O-antigen/teichoic acid export membrane protein